MLIFGGATNNAPIDMWIFDEHDYSWKSLYFTIGSTRKDIQCHSW